jgi:predicted tellurium resistance membrane protein TerC
MEFILPDFASAGVWMSLLTLTFLEIVLGIDNIIFISIASNKLKPEERPKATNIGLILAMVLRIVLLFGISVLIAMEEPWFSIHNDFIQGGFSGQSIILFIGGLFPSYIKVLQRFVISWKKMMITQQEEKRGPLRLPM